MEDKTLRRTHLTRKRRPSRHRHLRHERLEQRHLLAGMAFEGIAFPKQPDATTLPCTELCPISALGTSMELTMASAGTRAIDPVQDIYIPETIDFPGQRRNPRDFEPIPAGELGMRLPMPEDIDPNKLPGHGCPAGRDPDPPTFGTPGAYERSRALNDYWETQDAEDVSCDARRMSDAAFDNKWLHWYGPNDPHDPCPSPTPDDDGGGSKGDSGKDDGGTDDVKDKPIEDESGSQPPIKKDPDPEGDDPDEFRNELMDQAFAFYGMSGAQGTSSSSGLPTRTTGERGEGIGFRVRQEARPGIEDGDPAEVTSPTSVGAVDVAMLTDHSAYPTPDDDGDGPPPRPEAGQAELRAPAAFSASYSGLAGDHSAYPTPDDDGSGPPPPPTA